MQANQIPYAEEAESAVLGGVMQDARHWVDVSAILKPDDFYLLRNKYVFEVMVFLAGQGKAIDMVTVAGELRSRKQLEHIGGHAYLAQLIGSLVTARNIESYAREVADQAYRRRLLTASDKLRALALEIPLSTEVRQNKAATLLLEANASTPDEGDVISFNDELNQYMDDIKLTQGMKAGISGLSTGFYDLDELYDGLQPFSLNLFGGRPGMGKSALMLSIALYVAKKGGKVYFWSGEMPRKQLRERAVAVEAGIDTRVLRRGLRTNGMSDAEYDRFVEAVNRLAEYQIFFDDAPAMSPVKLQSRVERLSRRIGGLTLIVVDYLQLMKPMGVSQNRNLELGTISKFLKTDTSHIAPVLAGVQLNRKCEERANKRPILSDLRDSGELENDADTVSFVYRDVVYDPNTPKPNLMEIGAAKNRHGEIGIIKAVYEASYTRVRNAARGELL